MDASKPRPFTARKAVNFMKGMGFVHTRTVTSEGHLGIFCSRLPFDVEETSNGDLVIKSTRAYTVTHYRYKGKNIKVLALVPGEGVFLEHGFADDDIYGRGYIGRYCIYHRKHAADLVGVYKPPAAPAAPDALDAAGLPSAVEKNIPIERLMAAYALSLGGVDWGRISVPAGKRFGFLQGRKGRYFVSPRQCPEDGQWHVVDEVRGRNEAVLALRDPLLPPADITAFPRTAAMSVGNNVESEYKRILYPAFATGDWMFVHKTNIFVDGWIAYEENLVVSAAVWGSANHWKHWDYFVERGVPETNVIPVQAPAMAPVWSGEGGDVFSVRIVSEYEPDWDGDDHYGKWGWGYQSEVYEPSGYTREGNGDPDGYAMLVAGKWLLVAVRRKC